MKKNNFDVFLMYFSNDGIKIIRIFMAFCEFFFF